MPTYLRTVFLSIPSDRLMREISKEYNLVRGARKIMELGPSCVIAKRGEYGVLMVSKDEVFLCPAFPLEDVFDPTGAGDTFAGGFMGYLANMGDTSLETVKQAIIMGSLMASFSVEDFGINRIKALTYDEIKARYKSFRKCMEFGDITTLA